MKKNSIMKFIHNLKKEKFHRKQEVYCEGEEVDSIFIVHKGEFELTRRLKRSE